MKKRLLILLLLSGFLFSCGSEPAETSPEPAPETEAPVSDDSGFTYHADNYTFTPEKVTAAASAPDIFTENITGAFYEDPLLEEDFAAQLHVTMDSAHTDAGILFRARESTAYDGFEGYAFTIQDRRVYLYEISGTSLSGMKVKELASRVVERPKRSEGCTLRVERDGTTYRCYFLDDMEGVEPWPEFEFKLADIRGTGIGYYDNGHGASFDSLTVTAIENEEQEGQTYQNPVSTLSSADPFILQHDGTYYAYCTAAPIGYYVYTSPDLVHWTNRGLCAEMMWGIEKEGWYWAPEVFEKDGKFYLIAHANRNLGFAVADSPLGPFIPEENFLIPDAIDGHIFKDDDGRLYLYYVHRNPETASWDIYVCELNDDVVSIKEGTETWLMAPKDPWEKVGAHVVEGPAILKHNGVYYLTYSGTGYDSIEYAVGYATSDSPMGPFERYEANPVLSYTSKIHGPGHHSFAKSPDGSELFIVYHIHYNVTTVQPRIMAIDRVRFVPRPDGSDRFEIYGPTHTSQLYPK